MPTCLSARKPSQSPGEATCYEARSPRPSTRVPPLSRTHHVYPLCCGTWPTAPDATLSTVYFSSATLLQKAAFDYVSRSHLIRARKTERTFSQNTMNLHAWLGIIRCSERRRWRSIHCACNSEEPEIMAIGAWPLQHVLDPSPTCTPSHSMHTNFNHNSHQLSTPAAADVHVGKPSQPITPPT